MTTSRSTLTTTLAMLAFVLVIVGGPYAYLISRACNPSGVSDFFSKAAAFHSREGC